MMDYFTAAELDVVPVSMDLLHRIDERLRLVAAVTGFTKRQIEDELGELSGNAVSMATYLNQQLAANDDGADMSEMTGW